MVITGKPQELAKQLFTLDPNKEYDIKEHEDKKGRSIDANAYFHVLVNQLAKYNRNNGFAISDEEMKYEMNTQYGTVATTVTVPKGTDITRFYEYAVWIRGNDKYDGYKFYKRTRDLDSREFWQLLKGVEVECQKVGIETLDERRTRLLIEEYEKERMKNAYR